ncbi:hypothetical protein HDV05_008441 [Chytridiales sp. JEL 0842]|nr:hypothetical protein HDV05_008441 [Chytridiales sp. JEL 0842]
MKSMDSQQQSKKPGWQPKISTQSSVIPITPSQLMNMGNVDMDPATQEQGRNRYDLPRSKSSSRLSDVDVKRFGASSVPVAKLPIPALKPREKVVDEDVMDPHKRNPKDVIRSAADQVSSKLGRGPMQLVAPEVKKAIHKEAEQRRRDSLKDCFDRLKDVLPPVDEKNPSKLVLLKKTLEYISQLKSKESEYLTLIKELESEILDVEAGGV